MIKEVYLDYMGSKTKQKLETTYQLHLFKFTICMMTMEGHVSQANKLNSYFLVIFCAHHRYISPDKPPRPTLHLYVPALLLHMRFEGLSGPHFSFSLD